MTQGTLSHGLLIKSMSYNAGKEPRLAVVASSQMPRISGNSAGAKLRAEITNLLYEHARGVPMAIVLAAGLVALAFYGEIAAGWLYTWLAAVLLVELARSLAGWRFAHTLVTLEAASRWFTLYHIINVCFAVAWGLTSLLLFPGASLELRLLLAGVLMGMAGIGVPVLAVDIRAYATFLLLAVAPLVLQFLWLGDRLSLSVAGLCIVGAGMLITAAWRMRNDALAAVQARLAYADVAENYDAELTTRLRVEDTVRRSEKRSRRQSHILLELAREDSIASGELTAALKAITARAAQAVQCNRVSVWFCDPQMTEFRCVHLYNSGEHDLAPGFTLQTAEQGRLFRRLPRLRSFAVSDTRADRRMTLAAESYLRPFRITALLGATILQGGKVRGLVCYEHIGLPRNWTRDERAFASSLADFVSLAITSSGRQQAQEQLRVMANYDPLTNLANRGMLHEQIRHAIEMARRQQKELAVLFVDLDHFKKINDSLGHHVGDRVLRSIAKRVVRCVRAADTVARLGGDEFTVLLEEIENLETVITIAERIIAAVSETLVLGEQEINLSCSIGISHFPRDGDSVERLLQNADAAMYRAKKLGRNRYQFFTEDLHQMALHRLERENELRKALQNNEFRLVYQPQTDVHTGEIIGVEALVRWQHPGGELLSPKEFVSLAEETGLIVHLGEWVLFEACRQAQAWHDALGTPVKMGVNLSVGQFTVRNIAQWVSDVLRDTGFPAEFLVLEITESLAVESGAEHLELLSELKDVGIQLALDDFGTGNSSLSYLKHFPVDILKIDQSFVQGIPHDLHGEAIARATIGLAQSLGLEVVAEGVETEAQRNWLEKEGCYLMQGYLFSRPLFPDECFKLLTSSTSAKRKKRKA